jgi:hypothetical protein
LRRRVPQQIRQQPALTQKAPNPSWLPKSSRDASFKLSSRLIAASASLSYGSDVEPHLAICHWLSAIFAVVLPSRVPCVCTAPPDHTIWRPPPLPGKPRVARCNPQCPLFVKLVFCRDSQPGCGRACDWFPVWRAEDLALRHAEELLDFA